MLNLKPWQTFNSKLMPPIKILKGKKKSEKNVKRLHTNVTNVKITFQSLLDTKCQPACSVTGRSWVDHRSVTGKSQLPIRYTSTHFKCALVFKGFAFLYSTASIPLYRILLPHGQPRVNPCYQNIYKWKGLHLNSKWPCLSCNHCVFLMMNWWTVFQPIPFIDW